MAEWISESVNVMNDKKREKVVHCWGKTGLLAIWDVNERAALVPKAFAETSRLFPSSDIDNSGAVNEHDDQEQFNDFSSAITTVVNTATGMVASREEEEDAEVEDELIAAVVAQAESRNVARAKEGQAEDAQGVLMLILFLAVVSAPELYFLCCRGICSSCG